MGTSGGRKFDQRWRNARGEGFTADMINDVLNAATFEDAGEIFGQYVPYISEVYQIENFTFRGETYGPDYFD
jgi:hypothetical protein